MARRERGLRLTLRLGAVTLFDLALFVADEPEEAEPATVILGNEASSLGFTSNLPDRITFTDDEW